MDTEGIFQWWKVKQNGKGLSKKYNGGQIFLGQLLEAKPKWCKVYEDGN